MRLICKNGHNGFIKGKEYIGISVSNDMVVIERSDRRKWWYSLKPSKGQDFIETWFYTLEEVRNKKLEELGI
jgi:hypothetical protein